jgi:hypothetical protein
MKSDITLDDLRQETGSPLLVRVPFTLFGIFMNLSFLVYGWGDKPPWFWIGFALPAGFVLSGWAVKVVPFVLKHGMFFSWAHPILFYQWVWWLFIWPSKNEPGWRRLFAIGALLLIAVFFMAGVFRWGLPFPGQSMFLWVTGERLLQS